MIPPRPRRLRRPALFGFFGAAGLLLLVWRGLLLLGAAEDRKGIPSLGSPPVPTERTVAWSPRSALSDELQQAWAAQPLPDWRTAGQGHAPRILLARLVTRTQLVETNAYLQALRPWGTSGSRWALHPDGDYDFTLAVLTTLLWLRGDEPDTLFPAAREHLLRVLLTEEGGAYRAKAPRTLGLVNETENHILMTEGSRYLKNRWWQSHGNPEPRFDNVANGLEQKLLAFLGELEAGGLYEFNSQPYIGYTMAALLNLEAFAAEPVRRAARAVLDQMNWSYALGSLQLRHFPPYRRRYEYAAATSLTFGYQSAFMKAWLSFLPAPPDTPAVGRGGDVHAFMGTILPYRPPDRAVRLLFDKDAGYFAQLGHGPSACPEIYSAGRHFLLSAGGVHRGERSQIVARPITLLLADGATELSDVFHLAGPGGGFRQWNNTGVQANFAAAAGPVQVPSRYRAVREKGAWRIFVIRPGVTLAVYSTPTVGLLAVSAEPEPAALLAAILRENPDAEALRGAFQFPQGPRLTYDLAAPRDQWVMISVTGRPLDRDFDRWPRFQVSRF